MHIFILSNHVEIEWPYKHISAKQRTGTRAATYDPVVQFLYNIVNHSVILFGQEKGFTLKMEPNVVCGTIPMQQNPFLNGAKRVQTVPNWVQMRQTRLNRPNSVKEGQTCTKWGQLWPTGAIWNQLGPVMAFI